MSITKKRYLLNKDCKELSNKPKIKVREESLFYTYVQLCKEVRYKQSNKKYFKTIKEGSGNNKNRVNRVISKKEFEEAKKDKIGKIIKRDKYKVKVEGEKFLVKLYKNDLKNIAILEKRFKKYNKNKNYKLPTLLNRCLLDDISLNKRYLDKNLALLGDPKKRGYELYSLYKKIDHNHNNIENFLFKQMSVEDGIRIILYKIYNDLKKDAQNLLANQSISNLKKIHSNLKTSKVILRNFRYLFDKNMYENLYKQISMLYKYIDLRYVDILKNDMDILEDIFDEKDLIKFIKTTDESIENNKMKIVKFIKGREFKIFMEQFRLILEDPAFIHEGKFDDNSLYTISKKTLKRKADKLQYLIKKYDSCCDIDSYRKFYKSTNKLLILLERFIVIYDDNRYIKMIKKLKLLKENLLTISAIYDDCSLLKGYIKSNTKTLQIQNKMSKKVLKYKNKKEKNLYKKISKKLDSIKKKEFKFE